MSTNKEQFHNAAYGSNETNPYCPASDTGRADSCADEKRPDDDATFKETLNAFKNVYAQKKAEVEALSEVMAAETELVKKSLVVTALSLLASFTFACCCWLVINVALGIALHHAGLHFAWSSLVLIIINGCLAAFAFTVAKNAYKHLTFMPIVRAFIGKAGVEEDVH
ncbi:hypothetical protein CA267_016910 [Alteromonas pelagimontana]|uniref:Uncharacterized protein n=1 Tax=Alteromonas pelagimontana TaxID=1858656 RepID=A0A6M4MGR4_9ALTE|nr:hypothetical protein [Alteromonas pelagimontana]QJR82309.1 hypothetical protein CA267_016910 [Alteromonas pelagimontana]